MESILAIAAVLSGIGFLTIFIAAFVSTSKP